MSGLFGDTPTPPNPQATAAAQTGTNVATGVANAYLNNVNQVTPGGNLTFDVTGTHDWTDPSTGQNYSIPSFTATQSLPDLVQRTVGETQAAKWNLSQLGTIESQQLLNTLPNQTSPINDPSVNALLPGGSGYLAAVGDPTYTYGIHNQSQGIRDFGNLNDPRFNYTNQDPLTERGNVENALFQRVQPQNDRDLANLQAHLADQGIKYGSPAYQAAMDNYNRGITDQRLAITAQGGQEQQLQENLLKNQADFYNQAQQQQYQQLLGQGQFYNTAAQQMTAAQAAAAGFYNTAQQQELQKQAQVFDAMNQARNQRLQELYTSQNQPINQITALLSGSQISQPQFITPGQNRIATTDIGNLINQNFQQQLDASKQSNQNINQLLGGIFGAVAGSGVLSDKRIKKNVHKVGSVFAATPQKVAEPDRKELPIYRYSYKGEPDSVAHIGPMAQDVEKIDPGAVGEDARGVKYIDPRRVMGGIMRAA